MASRVTLQDIADALGVSRNTVSKAINNTGVLADATREKVLQKAIEMGYKQFSYANSLDDIHNPAAAVSQPKAQGEIALFMGSFLDNSHFASTMLDKFQHEISLLGYSLSLHRINERDIETLSLPLSFQKATTKAIMCIEMFDQSYCEMLSELGYPLLMVDGPVSTYWKPIDADILLMNNTTNIFTIVNSCKKQGITKIGFVGQATHCRSFFERYMAFRDAMYINNMEINEKFCLTEIHPHGYMYRDYLFSTIKEMDEFPEFFICANDFVAIDLLQGLSAIGVNCPKDIKVLGFDDSQESKIITPSLSTCHIHSQIMGYSAAHMIISRIEQPNLNYRTIYAETDLILRDSTK